VFKFNQKPTIINFRPLEAASNAKSEIWKTSPAVQQSLSELINGECIECNSWAELKELMTTNVVFVDFHADLPYSYNISIKDFVDRIKSVVDKHIPIAVVIRTTTKISTVEEYHSAGIAGVTLHAASYGVGDRTRSVKQLLDNKTYWPEEVLKRLPKSDPKPVSVYFNSDWDAHEAILKIDESEYPWTTKLCATWADLSERIAENPRHIILHVGMLMSPSVTLYEFISMIETLVKFTLPGETVPIGVVIEPSTHVSFIKELKKTSVIGIIPSIVGFGCSETLVAVDSIYHRQAYWPKHIIDSLAGNDPKPKYKKTDDVVLTKRQQEIFNLVTRRGLSNKKIAQVLNISESTVKVHVSAILKEYRVRNRTQLAVFASTEGLRT
jgi:DNA-binding NarL/FixJ family response regulator